MRRDQIRLHWLASIRAPRSIVLSIFQVAAHSSQPFFARQHMDFRSAVYTDEFLVFWEPSGGFSAWLFIFWFKTEGTSRRRITYTLGSVP